MKLYFFNSLYLLTNKTQMKMKKTQSLKLMLLGLFALVSGSAFAAVGDIFVSGDNAGGQLYYEQIAAKGAKLIGVQTVGQGGNIIIPTKAINTWMNKGNDLDVIEVADDWSVATQIVLQKVDANGNVIEEIPMGKSKALTDYDGTIKLQIDAENLLTISTKALQPLNGKISKFVVSADAGLTAIPDYAFFNGVETTPLENEGVANAIKALEKQKALIDLRIDGKDEGTTELTDGTVLYYLTELNSTTPKQPITLVIKGSAPDADGYFDLISPETGETLAKARDGQNGLMVDGNNFTLAAPNLGEVKGLQDQYDAAQANITSINSQIGALLANAAYQGAVTALNTAQQELDDAEGALKLYDTVKAYWFAAGDNVVTAVAGGPRKTAADLTAAGITDPAQVKAYNDIWDNIPNAKVTYKGKEYRYAPNGAGGYARPNSDALQQAKTDKAAALAAAQDNAKLKEMANLEDQLAQAQAEKAALEPYLTYWKGQRDAIAAQIKDKQDNELYTPVYTAATDLFGNVLNNEVLKRVDLLGEDLVAIGTSAFQNCVNAKFGNVLDSRLPLTTKTIAAKAFKNTIINPKFDNLVDLESIGDEAFAQSGATTANFSNATKLASFGANVFDDCKLKNLLLQGTPLKAIPVGLAENIYREFANFVDVCGTEWNKNGAQQVKVNQTLKEVSLPAAITEIRNGNFANCLVLATLTGGIPAGVTSIGDEAFFRTKIAEFDLSLLSKLTYIGEHAFAGNAQLTKVILPQNPADGYALTELPSNVFECDDNLEDVILGPDVTCLPAGIFAGNTSMKKLDLSNTQIEILYNLFQAGDGTDKDAQGNVLNPVNNTLVEIILPEETRNDDGKVVIPGLKIIMDYALANLQALKGAQQADGTYKMVIPSSVYIMRPYVFSNDIALEYVEAMDSRLTNLGVGTFEACSSLKEFKFITLQPINPAWVSYPAGGLANKSCPNAEGIVGYWQNQSYTDGYGQTIYQYLSYEDYKDQKVNPAWNPAQQTLISITNEPIYGPTVAFDAAMFNFDDMQFHGNHAAPVQVWVTEESKNNLDGYYRQTYDNNLVQYSKLNVYAFKLKLDKIKDGSYARTYYSSDFGTWIDTNEAGVFTAYQDYESVVLYKAKHNGGYFKIPAAHDPSTGRDFAPDGTNYYAPGNFIWSADDVAKPHNSAAVVIVSDKEEITIKRVTKPNEIYQSTLDRDNELRIAGTALEPSTHYPVHGFTFYNEAPVFWPYTSGKLKAGTVVLKASDYQGTGAPARIMNIIFVDDEATTIMGVKEYVKSLHNSDVIYNLNGMQVTTPVKGQIYIKGGKKFIQK